MRIYTVYDKKAKTFSEPFSRQNDGQAMRSFQVEINDTRSLYNRYPEDFALYFIAEFDEFSAKLTIDGSIGGLHIIDGRLLKDAVQQPETNLKAVQ